MGRGWSEDGRPWSEKMEELLHLDTLQIELGYGLLSLADPKKGGDLLERVTGVRRTFVQEMGFIIPAVRCATISSFSRMNTGLFSVAN